MNHSDKMKIISRIVNIGYRSIADTVSPILFRYRSKYRQYFSAQVSHAVSVIFLEKIPYLSDTFLLRIIFFRLDSFFDLDRVWCQSLPAGRLLL